MAGDFKRTDAELREVARYAAESAEGVLPQFERVAPDDGRPRPSCRERRSHRDCTLSGAGCR